MGDFERELAILKSGLETRGKSIEKGVEDLDPDIKLVIVFDGLVRAGGEAEKLEKPFESLVMWKPDSVIAYFVYADVILNLLEEKLLEKVLIREPYRDDTIVDYISDKSRGNVLRHFGVYGEYAKGVKKIHDLRNDLVHEPTETLSTTSIGEVVELMEVATEMIDGLEGLYLEEHS